MELTAALQKLDQLQRKQLAYSHAMGLIDYDGMTAAPSGTAANRAETLGITPAALEAVGPAYLGAAVGRARLNRLRTTAGRE